MKKLNEMKVKQFVYIKTESEKSGNETFCFEKRKNKVKPLI